MKTKNLFLVGVALLTLAGSGWAQGRGHDGRHDNGVRAWQNNSRHQDNGVRAWQFHDSRGSSRWERERRERLLQERLERERRLARLRWERLHRHHDRVYHRH